MNILLLKTPLLMSNLGNIQILSEIINRDLEVNLNGYDSNIRNSK